MTTRATYTLPGIYRGDDWNVIIGMYGSGGGLIGSADEGAGATLVDSSNQLVLPAGVKIRSGNRTPRDFNDDDIGQQVTLLNGVGLDDGTTIIARAPDGRSATLSANATADRTADAVFAVRAKDISGFTITGQCRVNADGDKQFDLPFVTDRYPYGVLEILMPSRARATVLGLPLTGPGATQITDTISAVGPYDIQFVDDVTGFTSTPVVGTIPFVKDITHP